MLKRSLLIGLVLALAVAIYPAAAKSKKPKPYKSQDFTIALSHPNFHSATEGNVVSVTAQEFFASCSIPASNGLDAHVLAVPKAYQKRTAVVSAMGSTVSGVYDLDLYFYDKSCENVGASNTEGTDEIGALPKGTAFIVVTNYAGEPGTSAHVMLKP